VSGNQHRAGLYKGQPATEERGIVAGCGALLQLGWFEARQPNDGERPLFVVELNLYRESDAVAVEGLLERLQTFDFL
jgi:hypothetical protein